MFGAEMRYAKAAGFLLAIAICAMTLSASGPIAGAQDSTSAVGPPAASPPTDVGARAREFVPWPGDEPGAGQLLVGFGEGRLPVVEPGQTIAGLRVLARVPQLDLLVVAAPDMNAAGTILGAFAGVTYIEADGTVHALDNPNDPRYGAQYGPSMMGMPAAWAAAGYGSASVTVAVLDSGIERGHPDFQGTRVLPGYDYVNRDANPNDDCGHGTHISGTVGANTNNAIGVAGISQATLLPMKVLGSRCSGSVSNIARAIVDATDQAADIITMSLGTSTNNQALSAAVAYAWDHGVILVAAAGNAGRDNSVHYPAAYGQVIAVSALDANKGLASYSSRGPQVAVAAPGTSILSTTSNFGYGVMSGTSMATPHVAGVLALALSCAPETSNQALRTALATTAADLGPAGRDNSFGFGLARADLLVAALCAPAPAPVAAPAPTVAPAPTASPPPTANRTISDSTFSALFAPAKGSNEWWVEVAVTGNAAVASVAAKVNGGNWQALPKTSWGAWAASFHVVKGSSVVFSATNAAGETAISGTYSWLGAPPAAGPFTAFFTPKTLSNPWWVEVAVQGSEPPSGVDVRLDGGAWTALPKTSWGTWAKSIHVLPGTQVVFRATPTTGTAVTSGTYTWQ